MNKLLGLQPATLIKKNLQYRSFIVNFMKYLGAITSQNTSKRMLLGRGRFMNKNYLRHSILNVF